MGNKMGIRKSLTEDVSNSYYRWKPAKADRQKKFGFSPAKGNFKIKIENIQVSPTDISDIVKRLLSEGSPE